MYSLSQSRRVHHEPHPAVWWGEDQRETARLITGDERIGTVPTTDAVDPDNDNNPTPTDR